MMSEIHEVAQEIYTKLVRAYDNSLVDYTNTQSVRDIIMYELCNMNSIESPDDVEPLVFQAIQEMAEEDDFS